MLVDFRLVERGFKLVVVCHHEGLSTGFEASAPVPYRTEAAFRRDYAGEIEPALAEAQRQLEGAAAAREELAARDRLVQPVERPAILLP